jgi:Tfp pilus assembly protein PilV
VEAKAGPPHRRWLLNERGFSVVEGLVSAGLLAICLLPIAYIQASGTRNTVAANQVATASALAVQMTEKIDNLRYADPRLASTGGAFVNLPLTLSPANPVSGIYTRRWRITTKTPVANSMTVDVQVQWNTYTNRTPNPTPRAVTVSLIKAAN